MNEQFHIVAHFDIIDRYKDEIFEELKTLIRETRKEPGCVKYILTRDDSSPLSVTFIETWATFADFESHIQAPHYLAWRTAAEGKLENRVLHKLKQFM